MSKDNYFGFFYLGQQTVFQVESGKQENRDPRRRKKEQDKPKSSSGSSSRSHTAAAPGISPAKRFPKLHKSLDEKAKAEMKGVEEVKRVEKRAAKKTADEVKVPKPEKRPRPVIE